MTLKRFFGKIGERMLSQEHLYNDLSSDSVKQLRTNENGQIKTNYNK